MALIQDQGSSKLANSGQRLTVTLDQTIYNALKVNVGKTKRFSSISHGINNCVAIALGIRAEDVVTTGAAGGNQ